MQPKTLALKTLTLIFLAALVAMAPLHAQQPESANPSPAAARARTTFGRLPLTFEENRGQTSGQVKFLSRGKGYTAFLTAGGMVLSLRPGRSGADPGAHQVPSAILQFQLSKANRKSVAVGEDPQPGKVNYFFGNNPALWHTSVPTYGRVRYKNVYPGIDLVYYGNRQQLEYDFAVAPGADPTRIQFAISGAEQIQIGEAGDLILTTAAGELHFQTPILYQESAGQRIPVQGGFVLTDANHIGFQLANYDSSKPLVIDPVLLYSTYLGGSGADQATGIAVDSTGSVYVVGYTDSTDFPLATLGALPSSTDHVFVAKLDPTGSNLVYADYLGGNNEDYGAALALDSANNVYLTGSTESSNFPVVNAFQAQQPGPYSGFLTKISAAGSALLYSTYFGGNSFDQPTGIAIDSLGHVHIAGFTSSQNFPTAHAYQPTALPNEDSLYGNYGFLSKFSSDGSALVYSTFVAGNSNVVQDCGSPCWPTPYNVVSALALDANGNAYVAGTTNTYNFPATSGAYLASNTTQQDATVGFVTKFNSAGSLAYSTYFYGSSGDPIGISAIAVDASSSAYITGTADSDGTFPITTSAICDPNTYFFGCSYGFVTKFDSTGSSLLYSTFLGPNNFASPVSVAVDSVGDAYILASGSSDAFQTNNAIEPYSSGQDLLLVELDPAAGSQLLATYLGGGSDDFASGLALDASGNIYIAGSTGSTDFPILPQAFQSVSGGSTDAFVAKIGPASSPAVGFTPVSLTYSALAVGSPSQAQTVLLRNLGSAALSISSLTASGDFAETDTCGTSVPAAGSCTFSITFTPTASGSRTGSVTLQDNAAGSPHRIVLTGIGIGPSATLSPATLTFPSQAIGVASASQPVTLTNSGNGSLAISSIQISGDFAQSSNCGANLASGAHCTINVVFTPTGSGARTGTLTVSDNDPSTPQTVSLSGTGAAASAPALSVTPTTLTFPSQTVGVASASQPVTLTNSGTGSAAISSIQISGDFAQSNNCGANLAAGSHCTINVVFTPTASGARTGSLTVSDNDPSSPQTVSLSGTGAVASTLIVSVTPATLTFTGTSLGVASVSQPVTVRNTGNASVSMGNAQVTGDFSQSNNCPVTLTAGSTCTFNVVLTPTATGSRTGTLTVNDNATVNPQTVSLSGTGVDFTVSATTTQATIKAGATATFNLSVAEVGGTFSSPVAFTCTGLPAKAACGFSPGSVTPGASSASDTLTITTVASSANLNSARNHLVYAFWLQFSGLGFFGMIVVVAPKRWKRLPVSVSGLLALVVMAALFMTGCAGGTGIGQTPPGSGTTYTVTVTGTSGALHHAVPLTLTVQ
jgi:hypothetical protein